MRAWRPPGRLWAPCGPKVAARGARRPGPSKTASERLLAALGAWGPLGASWASPGPPGRPGEPPGGHFWCFFWRPAPEPLNFMLLDDCLSFFHYIFESFLTIGCRPCGKAGASVHLEKSRFRSELVSNLAFRPFARTAKKRRNEAKPEEGKHTKNTIKTAYGTKTKKHHFWSQTGAPNRSQDPLFRSWRPVSRKIDPKTRPRALLGASGGALLVTKPPASWP